MTAEAIKDAIAHLSEQERKQLADWLEEVVEEAWDREMEKGLAPGGRGARLLAEVKADLAPGCSKPMDEFLGEAKARHDQSKTGT